MDRGVRFRVASIAGPIAVGYGLAASLAVGLALALRNGVPWQHPSPWLHLQPLEAAALSGFLGVVVALLVVVATRVTVWRFSWAQRLHLELRPIARGLVLWQIMLIASFSSLGEELVFRGLLQPWLGLLPTAVVFGLCHQMPGPARWVWVCWAMTVGIAFGGIFYVTGSLLGPLVAHAVINAVNLTFLRDHDPLATSEVGAPP